MFAAIRRALAKPVERVASPLYYPLRVGDVIRERYTILRQLGSGRHSTVWLSKDNVSGSDVALKIACADISAEGQHCINENVFLERVQTADPSHLGYSHVIHMHEHFQLTSPVGIHSCTVLDLLGQDLNRVRFEFGKGPLPVALVKRITKDVLLGLDYLHRSCGIIHTDIKPDNLLFTLPEKDVSARSTEGGASPASGPSYAESVGSSVVISDLGVASWKDDPFDGVVQSYCLRAPEIYLRAPWGPPIDIWGFGCVIFELATCSLLFNPQKTEKWSQDDDHLALMTEAFGPFPSAFLARGLHTSHFFDKSGELLRIPNNTLRRTSLKDILRIACHLDPEEEPSELFVDFLSNTKVGFSAGFNRRMYTRAAMSVSFPYKNIDTSTDKVTEISTALLDDPASIPQIESFRITDGLDDTGDTAVTEEVVFSASNALEHVLQTLSKQGHLKEFEWTGTCIFYTTSHRSPLVWDALAANARILERLNLAFFCEEEASFIAFASNAPYYALRSLRLDLDAAHGWDGSNLLNLLSSLPHVTSLSLILPTCCGVENLPLSFTLPKLQTLVYRSCEMDSDQEPPNSTFLSRHPNITSLSLHTDQGFDISDATLPNLRALSYDQFELSESHSPLFSRSRPLVHLRLHNYLPSEFPRKEDIENLAPRLRCLEINYFIHMFRQCALPALNDFSGKFPHLRELGITAESGNTLPPPDPLCAHDLAKLLAAVQSMELPQLQVLRLKDSAGKPLPAEFNLANLPPVPSTLQYIRWDVGGTRQLYRIERSGKKTIAVECEPLPVRGREWTDESVLDHMLST
ncbi:Serine/threonine-protein kinase SRPK [Grifola frondosa]|uniref:non-specific serine/threonine protein kinase n=1 Tax=Grifola frondosa TaxID=5627 RepID=A0A1C7M584_GRIFR|nr:Serine/threonine-protein kinase SRPK [Grifola frondosa]